MYLYIAYIDFISTSFSPLSANPTKWSNIAKQFVANSRRIVECVRPFCEAGA